MPAGYIALKYCAINFYAPKYFAPSIVKKRWIPCELLKTGLNTAQKK